MAKTAWVAMGLLILCAAAMAEEVEAAKPTDGSAAGKGSNKQASEKAPESLPEEMESSEFLDAEDAGGYAGAYFQDPQAAAAFVQPDQGYYRGGGGYGGGYGRGGGYHGGYGGRRGHGYGYGYGGGRGGRGRGW